MTYTCIKDREKRILPGRTVPYLPKLPFVKTMHKRTRALQTADLVFQDQAGMLYILPRGLKR